MHVFFLFRSSLGKPAISSVHLKLLSFMIEMLLAFISDARPLDVVSCLHGNIFC
jgi:hypothetical protein